MKIYINYIILFIVSCYCWKYGIPVSIVNKSLFVITENKPIIYESLKNIKISAIESEPTNGESLMAITVLGLITGGAVIAVMLIIRYMK